MKAISLWQPYASLIANGHKITETRSWKPLRALVNEQQTLAIHAAKRWTREEKEATRSLWDENRFPIFPVPRGVIVCTVRICAVYHSSMDTWREYPDVVASERYGDYSPGRYIWHLYDIRKIDNPPPFRGRQGFFNIPDDLCR